MTAHTELKFQQLRGLGKRKSLERRKLEEREKEEGSREKGLAGRREKEISILQQ